VSIGWTLGERGVQDRSGGRQRVPLAKKGVESYRTTVSETTTTC